jgi:hypothetical protein
MSDGWYTFDDGNTIGTLGSENGKILRDEEHSRGIRITLEHIKRLSRIAPFAITCGIYGAMFHTRFFSDESKASSEYILMKSALVAVTDPYFDSNLSEDEARQQFYSAISDFVEQFPT